MIAHMVVSIPRLVRFSSAEIAMYFADHNPPHFHVLGREGAALVTIEELELIAMSGRLDLREALEWAARNKELLPAKWMELSGP